MVKESIKYIKLERYQITENREVGFSQFYLLIKLIVVKNRIELGKIIKQI